MAAIIDPLIAAGIVFSLGMAALQLLQPAGYEADGMEAKMVFRLLLVPVCFAVLILIVDGVADHFYSLWRLQL
jgi:hypothetical protein